MSKKQKKVLWRIVIAAVLLVVLSLMPWESLIPTEGLRTWLLLALYLVPYFIIGYDILRKAVLGIVHG